MPTRPIGLILAVLGTLLLAITSTSGHTESAKDRIESRTPDRGQLEQRFASVRTLIERSTAARQIDETGDDAARQKHAQAREAFRQAEAALAAGDLRAANERLSQASVTMFDAARDATPRTLSDDKAKSDYRAKRDSVRALLDAQQRIATEKHRQAEVRESTAQVDSLLAEADAQASQGDTAAARATLERAYLIAKASIGTLRGGDTLVRSLHFANPKEEYDYELDRNDTHQMLIKVLLDEKNTQFDPQVRKFLQQAGTLRGQADAAASRVQHADAIDLLESSTGELVKAIRNAGVYIPG